MPDGFERLDDVDEMLKEADNRTEHGLYARRGMSFVEDFEAGQHKLREARKLLTETTTQLRADYGQMARARDVAMNLLSEWRDKHLPTVATDISEAITQTIALLQGGEDDEAE